MTVSRNIVSPQCIEIICQAILASNNKNLEKLKAKVTSRGDKKIAKKRAKKANQEIQPSAPLVRNQSSVQAAKPLIEQVQTEPRPTVNRIPEPQASLFNLDKFLQLPSPNNKHQMTRSKPESPISQSDLKFDLKKLQEPVTNQERHEQAKKVFVEMKKFLERIREFPQRKVLKAGSLGKNTTTKFSDVDIVVLVDVPPFNLHATIPPLAHILTEIFERENIEGCKMLVPSHHGPKLKFREMSVDITLAPRIEPHAVLEENLPRVPRSQWQWYSACFCEEQRKTIKPLEAPVKQAIKRLKLWNEFGRFTKSYTLEVLAFHFRGLRTPGEILNSVLIVLRDRLSMFFDHGEHPFPNDKWIILDPTNKFNNLASTVDKKKLDKALLKLKLE